MIVLVTINAAMMMAHVNVLQDTQEMIAIPVILDIIYQLQVAQKILAQVSYKSLIWNSCNNKLLIYLLFEL